MNPVDKRKHFIVSSLIWSEDGEVVVGCVLEAVFDKQQITLDWRELRDSAVWLQGWK